MVYFCWSSRSGEVGLDTKAVKLVRVKCLKGLMRHSPNWRTRGIKIRYKPLGAMYLEEQLIKRVNDVGKNTIFFFFFFSFVFLLFLLLFFWALPRHMGGSRLGVESEL